MVEDRGEGKRRGVGRGRSWYSPLRIVGEIYGGWRRADGMGVCVALRTLWGVVVVGAG